MELGITLRMPGRRGEKHQDQHAKAKEALQLKQRDLSEKRAVLERYAVSDVPAVPVGEYIYLQKLTHPLGEQHLEYFAAIKSDMLFEQKTAGFALNQPLADSKSSKSHRTYLLMTPDMYLQSRGMLDVAQRLKADNHLNIYPLISTWEIIRAVHHNNAREISSSDSEQTSTQTRVRQLLLDAAKSGASDIHIEARENKAEVLLRIDGRRYKMGDISLATAEDYGSVLFNFESTDIARKGSWTKREIKDTNFDVWDDPTKKNKRLLTVRFHSTAIHPDKFQLVLRLLRPAHVEGGFKKLSDVGYSDAQREQVEKMLIGGSGLVVFVGPTNSGKSSSLQSCIQQLYENRGPNIKVCTIESPVEYEIPNACQMPATKDTFNVLLEATLRQDPDVVMVGEIRESQAAKTVKDLVLAGHKILSSIHGYSAMAAFSRLEQLGVDIDLMTMPGFISGFVYQRLLPIVCPECSLPFHLARTTGMINEGLFNRLTSVSEDKHNIRFINEGRYFINAENKLDTGCKCETCNGTGILGRTPIAEIIIPDEKLLGFIKKKDEAGARDYWLSTQGEKVEYGLGVSALSHAIQKMRQGIVDPRDVEHSIGMLRRDGF